MSFKRETRYHVIKLSTGKPGDCVVIESDWPEYEVAWKLIEDRMEGRPSKIDILRTQLQVAEKERDAAKALLYTLMAKPTESECQQQLLASRMREEALRAVVQSGIETMQAYGQEDAPWVDEAQDVLTGTSGTLLVTELTTENARLRDALLGLLNADSVDALFHAEKAAEAAIGQDVEATVELAWRERNEAVAELANTREQLRALRHSLVDLAEKIADSALEPK